MGSLVGNGFDEFIGADGKLQRLDHNYVVKQLLEIKTSHSSIVAQMYARDYYETFYQITAHDQGTKKSIMPLIAFADVEDTSEVSHFREYMVKYRKSGVKEIFDIPFDRFIQLPVDTCASLMEEAEFAIKEKAALIDPQLAEIENTLKKK